MSVAHPSDIAAPTVRKPASSLAGLLGVVVSGSLFAVLYTQLDGRAVWVIIQSASPFWLAVSTGAIVPITLIVARRFHAATPPGTLPSYWEAVRLILVATAFNMFLPAKSGDLVKSYFVAKRGNVPTGVALSIIVYERLCDLLGLVTWCLVGWFVRPPAAGAIHASGWLSFTTIGAGCLLLVTSERSAGRLLAIVHRLFPSNKWCSSGAGLQHACSHVTFRSTLSGRLVPAAAR